MLSKISSTAISYYLGDNEGPIVNYLITLRLRI